MDKDLNYTLMIVVAAFAVIIGLGVIAIGA
ncbi:YnhF family membrane protein [Vibrio hannami]|nr:YnhF family membrane protein [Vibrio hannami]MDG3087637.1 YnhF family membrane protein [Vibrio hannami]